MKLFKVLMSHYAPKGSETAIKEYVIAETHKDVFDYLHDRSDYTYWKYKEWSHEEKTTVCFGQGHSALEEDLTDLYYGYTEYNWEQVAIDLSDEEINSLLSLKVAKLVM